ncbi:sigma factor-like helix-turn-helix DNA-binding protein [Mesobacillus zeae]|uniref:sigma factor-like helix-turn-helix DNA-binding protein n=1 Tax=Mesobacillus zeae TaxID=1917180 RepID=UPI00300B9328
MEKKVIDYNEKLLLDYENIHDKVKRGMLPLVARNPAIDKAVSNYVDSQTEFFDAKKNRGEHSPIQLRNSYVLSRFADLVMYEELKWSHPDKMTIVDYPIMSDDQEASRTEKYRPNSDIQYGDRRYSGRRKTHFTDDQGSPQVRNSRVVDPHDPTIDAVGDYLDLYDALDSAGLTERQREAIDLVYFVNMTQEEAAEVMGVGQDVISRRVSVALRKLCEYMTKC